MKRITIVLIPEGTKVTKTFKMPQFLPKLGFVASLVVLFFAVFFGLDYLDLRRVERDYAKLVTEHSSLRSEVKALGNRLQEVKQTLHVVHNYTTQLDELTQINNNKLNRRTGIGALSVEEYSRFKSQQETETSEVPMGVNIDDLTYSLVFTQMNEIQSKAHKNIFDMQRLLSRLGKKRSLLSSIPSVLPVDGWISSGYGYRISPFTGKRAVHRGVDIASAAGTPVVAPADGVVIFSGVKEDFGNFIMIAHGYGVVTRYGHNAHNLVQSGQKVKRGDQIATVGSSGRTTGPHLHYEVWVNGRPSNPKKFILGFGEQQIF